LKKLLFLLFFDFRPVVFEDGCKFIYSKYSQKQNNFKNLFVCFLKASYGPEDPDFEPKRHGSGTIIPVMYEVRADQLNELFGQ
jgi:hypothetical protein